MLNANPLLQVRMSEYYKLAEINAISIIRSVEDERTFSTLHFRKSRLRNRLTINLDDVVKLFSQSFYDLENFSYQEAISV